MQSTASNLEFKLNVNLRVVKPDFMQSTAVKLELKLKAIIELLSKGMCFSVERSLFLVPFSLSRYSGKGNRYAFTIGLLKAPSHYNVLGNVCRRMKYISSTLAYDGI